jgi:hypothetical protein
MLAACSNGVDRIQVIEDNCGKCHNTEIVYAMKRPMLEWERLVYGMKVRGMQISDEDEKILMREIYKNLSTDGES